MAKKYALLLTDEFHNYVRRVVTKEADYSIFVFLDLTLDTSDYIFLPITLEDLKKELGEKIGYDVWVNIANHADHFYFRKAWMVARELKCREENKCEGSELR